MNSSLPEALRGALRRLNLPCLRAEGNPTALVTHVQLDASTSGLVIANLDAAAEVVWLELPICAVPLQRKAEVALLLAELNATYKAVAFTIRHEMVVADLCVDLAFTSDAEACLARAIVRLLTVLGVSRRQVLDVCREAPPRSKLERQVGQILERLDE